MPALPPDLVRNVLTFDVEDYFHVSAFDAPGRCARWNRFSSRVEASTDRILRILDDTSTRATFFVLGWVADYHPALVRRIAAAGHEVASHGYGHQLVYDLSPSSFREDLRRAKRAIEDACGIEVQGYRAPSFSVTRRSLWAIDILIEEGYRFDSSIFPIVRDRYGLPGAPRHAHNIRRPSGRLLEIPPSTLRWAGMTVPVAGGGYFRLYPYSWTERAVRHLNDVEHRPAVVYLHPWELDPDQPRQRGTLVNRFRHYVNLDRTEQRLRHLVGRFSFGPVRELAGSFVDVTTPELDAIAATPAISPRSAPRPRAA